jgi:anti-anti-sigma regulatory factor
MGRLNVKVKQNNGKVCMRLTGELNGSGACQMENALERLRHVAEASRLTLDFSGIREFDYFGVVQSARAIRAQRRRFFEISLTGLKETTESLFKRFGLENGTLPRSQL